MNAPTNRYKPRPPRSRDPLSLATWVTSLFTVAGPTVSRFGISGVTELMPQKHVRAPGGPARWPLLVCRPLSRQQGQGAEPHEDRALEAAEKPDLRRLLYSSRTDSERPLY